MFGIDDAVVGAVVGEVGSSLLGGLFGSSSAKKQNKAAAEAQMRANQFTERMMTNRHQWEVYDLKKAGLNPILSAGGTPSMGGSQAAPVVDEGHSAREAAGRIANAIPKARDAQLLRDQIKLQNSQIVAQTNSAEADARLKSAQTSLTNITAALDAAYGEYDRLGGIANKGINTAQALASGVKGLFGAGAASRAAGSAAANLFNLNRSPTSSTYKAIGRSK